MEIVEPFGSDVPTGGFQRSSSAKENQRTRAPASSSRPGAACGRLPRSTHRPRPTRRPIGARGGGSGREGSGGDGGSAGNGGGGGSDGCGGSGGGVGR